MVQDLKEEMEEQEQRVGTMNTAISTMVLPGDAKPATVASLLAAAGPPAKSLPALDSADDSAEDSADDKITVRSRDPMSSADDSADDSADGKITVGSRDPVSGADHSADDSADNTAPTTRSRWVLETR
jgi:hypothetical protein